MGVRRSISGISRTSRASRLATLVLLLALTAAPAAAERNLASEGALGLGAAACSLVYSPLKLVYAAGGLALSTVVLLWTFGDTEVAGTVFAQTVGGDYVVTPDHLVRARPLYFFGN